MFGGLIQKILNAASAKPSAVSAKKEPRMTDFAGRWLTTFGPMTLQQDGDQVHGEYEWQGETCQIQGRIEDGKLRFKYQEPKARGMGWFTLERPGKFIGKWQMDGDSRWLPWIGERGFEGLWSTTFGMVRLIHEQDRVLGFYEGLGSSYIEGQLQGGRLVFRYREPKAQGDGEFVLAENERSFEDQWKADGEFGWKPWIGKRVADYMGQIWLVVIEAHWQAHLMDKEYSFGNMLREFFARIPGVQFSHRFFTSEEGLRRWCRDLIYLAAPAVVVIASHATEEGLCVHGQTVSSRALSESLRYADNIQLLHFSSCLMMKDGPGMDLVWELHKQVRFPISGYTTSVDWAASAIAEFTYLDMILGKGLSPVQAAEQLTKLVAFAGDKVSKDAAYPAAGFRILLPKGSE